MKHLARAVIDAVLFLEFSNDNQVNPDDAVRTMENIADALRGASPEEVTALKSVIDDDLSKMHEGGSEKLKEFYTGFFSSCGIEPEQ